MTAARRQLDLGFDEIESIRQLAGALQGTVDDLVQRYRPETDDASSRIVMTHCMKALRSARGLPMPPHQRAIVEGAYQMVRRQLGAA
jgi:hypothetical protein